MKTKCFFLFSAFIIGLTACQTVKPFATIPAFQEKAVEIAKVNTPNANAIMETGISFADAMAQEVSETVEPAASVAETTDTVAETTEPPAEPLPNPAEPSSINPQAVGFSPRSVSAPSIGLEIAVGNPEAVTAWSVAIRDTDGNGVRTWFGDGTDIPASIEWYGTDEALERAPEAIYNATLDVAYGGAFDSASVPSAFFVLVASAPQAALSVVPRIADPANGVGVTFDLTGSSYLARMADWSIAVADSNGRSLADFAGEGGTASVYWDARDAEGKPIAAAATYRAMAAVRDEFGNVSRAEAEFKADIGTVRVGDRYRVDFPFIFFRDFSADFVNVPVDLAKANIETLDRLADALADFPEYRIEIEGHAVMIYWFDAEKGKREQAQVLIPLSLERADAVKKALADRGIDAARISTAGKGALDPLVPNSDLDNRWRNRRTEVFLSK